MSDKLCGLAGLGLDNLEDMDIFGQEKKEEQVAAEAPKIEEKGPDLRQEFHLPGMRRRFSRQDHEDRQGETFRHGSGSSCKIRRNRCGKI